MNRRLLAALLLGATLTTATGAEVRDFSQLYPSADLRNANSVYSPNITAVLNEDVAAYLSRGELQTLRRVTLLQPWDRTRDPFEFSAQPATGRILIPTLSVKFLDDIAIATAWYERFGCNKASVFDYVASLDFGEQPLQAPLPALGVPERAYEKDVYVDDVSQKILKSALAFLLLHELGHVHKSHQGYGSISALQAQAQEAEADAFAMSVLRRMRLPPLGMTVWFMAVSMRDPLAEGSQLQTHPLTASRLQAIAADLRNNPDDFIEAANRGKMSADEMRDLAREIETIANDLDDPQLRQLIQQRGRMATPELLLGSCDVEAHEGAWTEKLQKWFE